MTRPPKHIEPIDADFDDVASSTVKSKNNQVQQQIFPLIIRELDRNTINQRANDGYINATALCKAVGKKLNHYGDLKTTREFLKELSSDTGIPVSGLVQSIKGGVPQNQGTWVHPQVAINLGQWASPKFAVLVSKWVTEWMSGNTQTVYTLPDHVRRYMVNRHKIPPNSFFYVGSNDIKIIS